MPTKNSSSSSINNSKSPHNPFLVIPRLIAPLSSALSKFRSGKDSTAELTTLIQAIDKMRQSSFDAALAATHLIELDSPLKQPLFSAIICNMVSTRLNYDMEHKTKLLLAILTANISLAELQVLLNQSDNPLTDEQWQKIRRHPINSCEILKKAGVSDTLWLNIIEQHHERIDGSGYPHQLKDEQICDEALLVSLGEFYTAMIDKRAYRSAKSSQEAFRELYEKSTPREKRIQVNFIKVVGVFSPGTYVKLANKEIAVVWKRNGDKVMPLVKSLFNATGEQYMGGLTRDASLDKYKILACTQPPRKPTLDLHALWS